MNLKSYHPSEALWKTRLAPFYLAAGLAAVGISCIWVVLPFGCLALTMASGVLVALFHLIKWRTGRERYQNAAMFAGLMPIAGFRLILPETGPFVAQLFQYAGIYLSAYAVILLLLRRRILSWIQS